MTGASYQVMPDLSDADFAALKADIDRCGVLVPVEYDEDGNILDGHHRVRACRELGIDSWPRFIRKGLSDDEKRTHARQLNIARRHLNQEQKRDLTADQLRETPALSDRAIGSALGVDGKTVRSVRTSLEATAEIPQLEKTVGADGRARRKPIPTRHEDDSPSGQIEAIGRAKDIRAKKNKHRREERLNKIAEISAGNAELNTTQRYPVIYADPPWRYENPPIGDSNRSIENHYPTMTLDEICALPVAELATEDAILYMWATAPKLAECFEVIDAWQFDYRTCLVWDKQHIGMGYYARNQHELLLVARRGELPPPLAGTQPPSVYSEKRGDHSAKPLYYYEMIEAAYPQLPKIELFSRSPRDGWAAWGNQAGDRDAA